MIDYDTTSIPNYQAMQRLKTFRCCQVSTASSGNSWRGKPPWTGRPNEGTSTRYSIYLLSYLVTYYVFMYLYIYSYYIIFYMYYTLICTFIRLFVLLASLQSEAPA